MAGKFFNSPTLQRPDALSVDFDHGCRSQRLLFVVNDAEFFISHRLPIAREAQRRGYAVHLATGLSGERAISQVRAAGLHYHAIAFDGQSISLKKEAIAFIALFRLLIGLRPDILHLVTPKAVLYGGIAARFAGVRAVVSALCGMGYVYTSSGFKARMLRPWVRLGLRFALGHRNQKVIVQNHDDHALLLQQRASTQDRLKLIPGSGVDLWQYSSSPADDGVPVVLLPARLLWDKGVGEFVEAGRLLKQRGIACRMVLAGTAAHANPNTVPREIIEKWSREGLVEWWGHRDDMPHVFSRAHIVCLPSYYREGIPKALLEAAACGRPVVTTDSVGCREAIEPGITGLLVPPRDPVALADTLATLLADPDLRLRMGQAGRERAVRMYSIHAVVRETLALYEQLLPAGETDGRSIRFLAGRSSSSQF